jgi:hypothetical protein
MPSVLFFNPVTPSALFFNHVTPSALFFNPEGMVGL